MSQAVRALGKVLKRRHDELIPQIIASRCPCEVERLGKAQKRIRRLIRIFVTVTK